MYELSIAGLFIVFFSISDNFVGDIIGCKTRKLFIDNMWFKHLSLLFFIYFAVNFAVDKHEHPLITFRHTLILWVFYIIFVRLDTLYLGISFFILLSYYVLENYKNYLMYHEKEKYKSYGDTLEDISQYLLILLVIPLVLGFYKNYKYEKRNYGKSFEFIKFILGHKKCKLPSIHR